MYSSPCLGPLRIGGSVEVVRWSGAILESYVPMKGNGNVSASQSGLSTVSESFSSLPANSGKNRAHRVFMMELRPTTGDAVPGPLAFFALRQQHDKACFARAASDPDCYEARATRPGSLFHAIGAKRKMPGFGAEPQGITG